MKKMKIAFPTSDRVTVEGHFGHCAEFAVCHIEAGEEKGMEFVTPPAHAPGVFPAFLGELGVNTIITGGMGQRAVDLFKNQNIEVILGAEGMIRRNLGMYLEGIIESTGSVCSHNHDENSCSH